MLSLAGQWPYQKRKERLPRMTIVFLTELSLMVTQVGRFIQCGKNLQCILIGIPTYLLHTVIMVKLLTCQFCSSKVGRLIQCGKNLQCILIGIPTYLVHTVIMVKLLTCQFYSSKLDRQPIENRHVLLYYTFITAYYYISCPLFVLFSLTPKILDKLLPLNESRPILLPHECHYFVDHREYFYYIFFHVLISTFIVLTGLLAHDCVILTYIEHVCGIFAVAGFRFQNLAHNTDKENDKINVQSKDIQCKTYNQEIALSVHVHWRALQYAEFLKNTFSVTLVIQMFIVIVAMSVTLLQMVVQLENIIETTRYMAFVTGQLIHIFCFSLQGQRLIDHSLQIHDKIYNCSWSKIPVKSQKLLLNIMRRSSQPNILSAGRIYVFSLKSFMTVLQSSMSYFTVLASFQSARYRRQNISLKTMESVWNYYYSITKRMLSLAGQWPYQNRRERLLRVILVTMTEFSVIVPQMGKFIQCDRDVHCIFMTIPTYLMHTVIIVKLYTCQFNSGKIKKLTDQLYSHWKHLESPEECEIMKMYAAKARLFSFIYSSYYVICCPMFVLISLTPQILDIVLPLNESRPILLPYEAHYFVHDDREYFYYIFFHALIAIMIVITGVLAHDCMVLTYVEHVCSIFAVAGFRFENLTCNNAADLKINNSLIGMYNQKIAISVHAHWQALQFAELLEDTFSVTFAIQIAIVTVAMSISLLQMAVQLDDILETIRCTAFVVGQLIHLFCFSLQGQKLIDHSLQMHDKIYNCSWYKIPVKSQRLLLNVMRRSLQPNILTAGGLYIFSLKSFTTVLQSSVSYFTVLASFQ
ncbi:uncharacterized protein LOC105255147 [Camponotus floridanus]|uniref:uncharacterized protein LOC105255147 n=1 Tax=Camponotus floridanus TaxID=104421 RepID=UPI000DC69D07|nr:uncharacterized protein LOC105255147 [Camponotus floridanus]